MEIEECCGNNICFAESFPEKDTIEALKCRSLRHHTCLGSLVSNTVHGKAKAVSVLLKGPSYLVFSLFSREQSLSWWDTRPLKNLR